MSKEHPVCDAVWDLYRAVVVHFGPISTMMERKKAPIWPALHEETAPPALRRLPEPLAIPRLARGRDRALSTAWR